MKRYVSVILAVVFTFVVAASALAADKPIFVMVPKGVHPYYEPCFEGFKAAAEKYGITAEYEAPQDFDIALQVKVLEDLISRGVNGIALSALDDKPLIPVVQQALDAGIQILTFDAPAPSSAALSYIGTDNFNAGYAAGKKLAELMGNKGEVVILQGGLGAPNLNLRREGMGKAFQEVAPEIKIVSVEDEEGKFDLAMNKTEAVLATYPNLKAIFGVSAEAAPSAAKIVKEQGKAGKVLVAGFDDLKDTLDGIRDGSVQFCLVQKTYKMGWLSVENLIKAGKKEPVEKLIDTGVVFVEKANVDTYMAEMKKEFAQ
jgi:ribose transport system substrate-binding protein